MTLGGFKIHEIYTKTIKPITNSMSLLVVTQQDQAPSAVQYFMFLLMRL